MPPPAGVLAAPRMKIAKRLVHSTLKRFGYRLTHEDFLVYGLEPFFRCLKRLGFAPRHIVDVGANRGVWTRTAIHYFPDALYTLVEPQDYLKTHVADLIKQGCNIRWLNAGVADTPCRLSFAIFYCDDSSTFVLEQDAVTDKQPSQIMVDITTLNEIIAVPGTPMPEMVKIDAEGFDLKVLAGASGLFGKTEIFLVEAVVYGGHENKLLEVTHRMAAFGYHLFDITDLNRSPKYGNLWVCELAFLRNGSSLLAQIASYE